MRKSAEPTLNEWLRNADHLELSLDHILKRINRMTLEGGLELKE